MTRQLKTIFMLATGVLIAGTCAIRAAQPAPTTASSTNPTQVSLRGRVSLDSGLGLQKPDLSRVVVYVATHPELDSPMQPQETASVAQKNKAFVPNFLVVPRNTVVEFPNWDDYDHNVFSRSKAAPAFDLERYPRGMSKSRVFEKLGVVQVFCNIHPSMRAVIFVVPNRFFTRADADGNFQIAGLPAGKYEVVAWHERCDEKRQTIEVSPNAEAKISFDLKESRERTVNAYEGDRHASYGGVTRGLGMKRERLDLPVVTECHPATNPSKQ